MELSKEQKNLYKAGFVLVIILCASYAVDVMFSLGYRGPQAMGMGTINVSGQGEISAVPDIASVYFTISKDAATVKAAQGEVAKVESAVLTFLRASGVEDKDIKTQNVSFYPKYSYQRPCVLDYCSGSTPARIIGYTASESITVTIRNTDDAAKVVEGLGGVGVTDLNGPNFEVDDQKKLQQDARKLAIENARAEADALAKQLGVRIVGVSSFSESGSYPGPYNYAYKDLDESMSAGDIPAAELPTGESTIISNVTITYEIR